MNNTFEKEKPSQKTETKKALIEFARQWHCMHSLCSLCISAPTRLLPQITPPPSSPTPPLSPPLSGHGLFWKNHPEKPSLRWRPLSDPSCILMATLSYHPPSPPSIPVSLTLLSAFLWMDASLGNSVAFHRSPPPPRSAAPLAPALHLGPWPSLTLPTFASSSMAAPWWRIQAEQIAAQDLYGGVVAKANE